MLLKLLSGFYLNLSSKQLKEKAEKSQQEKNLLSRKEVAKFEVSKVFHFRLWKIFKRFLK